MNIRPEARSRRHRPRFQGGLREVGKKCRPIHRGRQGRGRTVVRQRRKRIPKRRVQVHGATLGLPRALECVRHRLPQVAQSGHGHLRHREFVEKRDVIAVELLLIDCLAGCARPHLRRAVRRDDQQRHAALPRLNDGGKVIRGRRAAGANERRGTASCLGQSQREKCGRPLVEHGDRLDPGMPREGKRQGRRARTGRNDGGPNSPADQRLHQHARPQGLGVAGVGEGRRGHADGRFYSGGRRGWRGAGPRSKCGVAPTQVSSASSMALNLSSVSENSFSGVEPATMPAPA